MPASKKGQKRYTAKKDVAADKEVVQPTSDVVVAHVKPVAATLPETTVSDTTRAAVPEVVKTAVPEVVGTTASSDAVPSEKVAPTTAESPAEIPAETAPTAGDMQPSAATAAEAVVLEVADAKPPAATPPETTPPDSVADGSQSKKDASSDEESTAAGTTSLQGSSKPGSFHDVLSSSAAGTTSLQGSSKQNSSTDAPQSSMCCVRATCDFTKPGESLALIGGDAALGAWNTKEAVILSTSAESFPTWSGKVMKPAAGAEFKLIIVRADGSIMWEPIEGNRTWPIDDFSNALAFGSR